MFKKIRYFLLTNSVGFGLNLLSLMQPKKSARIAYRLFSHPRKGKREVLPDYPADEQQDPRGGDGKKRQIYEWQKEGEGVCLIHGWGSKAYRWVGLFEFLRRKKHHILTEAGPAQGSRG